MTKIVKGEPEEMSAQKRKNFLIGFGGVAIVLALAVVFLSPKFLNRSDNASGAIGAVQKHRAPQIKQTDVVLGDEQTKKDQQVLYVDYVNDAAALQNISADLQSAEQSFEARAQAAQSRLEAQKKELQGRFLANADFALASMDQLGKAAQDAQLAQKSADLGKMVQDFGNKQSLEAKDFAQLSAQILAASSPIFVEPCCGGKLRNQALEKMSSDLGAVSQLSQAIDNEALASRLKAQTSYLSAMAMESKSLEAVSRELQSKSLDAKSLGRMSSELLQAADQLQAKAVANMEMSLSNYSEAADALGKADHILMSASLDSKSLESARKDLAAKDAQLMARAQANRDATQALAARLNSASQLNQRALASAMPDVQQLAQRANDLLSARQK
jgi:hypothetical protein